MFVIFTFADISHRFSIFFPFGHKICMEIVTIRILISSEFAKKHVREWNPDLASMRQSG